MDELQQRLLDIHEILYEADKGLSEQLELTYTEDLSFGVLADAHEGIRVAMQSLEELYEREIPFEAD
jgi:hypothetical protein